MIEKCNITRFQINRDKDILIVQSNSFTVFTISSKKWNTIYIPNNNDSYQIEKTPDNFNLIRIDKMGYKSIYENIDRFNKKDIQTKLKKLLTSLKIIDKEKITPLNGLHTVEHPDQ